MSEDAVQYQKSQKNIHKPATKHYTPHLDQFRSLYLQTPAHSHLSKDYEPTHLELISYFQKCLTINQKLLIYKVRLFVVYGRKNLEIILNEMKIESIN